ncbi:MAG TPA: extracellular solute-binding protein, partial [Actinobacteria bacterium]|nr:extracellular solute-binding protein [Actinomycetota bacterium]
MKRNRLRALRWMAMVFAFVLVGAACGTSTDTAGEGETTTATAAESVTTTTAAAAATTATTVGATATTMAPEPQRLLVWNKDETDTFQELIRLFREDNPGVEIELVDRSFENYDTAVALALTSDNPPDVLQQSFAYKSMGAFVKAGEVMPLDAYADQYDWWTRLGTGAASLSFSADGLDYGVGNLYGVHMQGEVVGIYYNKAKLAELGIDPPSTMSEFEAALAAARDGGLLPINLAGATAWTLGQMYHVIQGTIVPAVDTLAWVYGQEGASFDTPGQIEAAQYIADWQEAGYFSDDALGFDYPTSLGTYGGGEGVFMFQGSWANGALSADLGDDLGFFALANDDGEILSVTSTVGASWGIGARTASPDLAAKFIDFVSGPVAAELMAQAGNLVAFQEFTTTKPEPGSS